MLEAGERLRKRWYLEQFIFVLLVNLRYVVIESVVYASRKSCKFAVLLYI